MAGPNTGDPADQWCNFITQSQTFAFVGLALLLRSSQKFLPLSVSHFNLHVCAIVVLPSTGSSWNYICDYKEDICNCSINCFGCNFVLL
uniref:Uncharacterized protein n=1 Tax=Anguilla anguilla TaxID=7936 RepID=A0A0E9QEU5_ANGAN